MGMIRGDRCKSCARQRRVDRDRSTLNNSGNRTTIAQSHGGGRRLPKENNIMLLRHGGAKATPATAIVAADDADDNSTQSLSTAAPRSHACLNSSRCVEPRYVLPRIAGG